MNSFDRFRLKMEQSGGSLREEKRWQARELLKETFYDDPSFRTHMFRWSLGKTHQCDYTEDDEPIPMRIFGRTYSAANGVTMKFQTPYTYPIEVGDIIYDYNEDEFLLCTEVQNIDEINFRGKFTLCNWILKWQLDDGTIVEYPCYELNTTQYNSGEQSIAHMTVGSAQHMILLPYDENTVVLETPRRFFLDRNTIHPTTYQVTQNDTTSYFYGKKGIVRVTVYQYAYDPDVDRIDLGICDYFELEDYSKGESAVEDVPSSYTICENDGALSEDDGYLNITRDYELTLLKQSRIDYKTTIIKSGGNEKKFTAVFLDADGNKLTHIKPVWTIMCEFYEALNVRKDGNDIYLSIDNDNFVDEKIRLILDDGNGNCRSTLILTVKGLV